MYYHIEIEHVTCMNVPDAVPGSVVRNTDVVPPVRVSIALIHTETTPAVSFTEYMAGTNPTWITAINHSLYYYMHPYVQAHICLLRVYMSYLSATRNALCTIPYKPHNMINHRYLCCQ